MDWRDAYVKVEYYRPFQVSVAAEFGKISALQSAIFVNNSILIKNHGTFFALRIASFITKS